MSEVVTPLLLEDVSVRVLGDPSPGVVSVTVLPPLLCSPLGSEGNKIKEGKDGPPVRTRTRGVTTITSRPAFLRSPLPSEK